jgi:hypothetical protein
MLNKFKKILNKIMNGYDIETLIAVKSSFQANKFQWIKTNDPNKMGKVVEVRDVVPGRNGRFIAMLSDGSQIDTDMVSSNLMMITDGQDPLSFDEIRSINYIPSLSEEVQVSKDIPTEFVDEIKSQVPTAQPIIGGQPAQIVQAPSKFQLDVDPGDLFGMFSLEDTDLNLSVKIKLPSKTLLKMMYQNSKNKEEFLTKLSNYINNNVTVDAIKKTMKKALAGDTKKKTITNE